MINTISTNDQITTQYPQSDIDSIWSEYADVVADLEEEQNNAESSSSISSQVDLEDYKLLKTDSGAAKYLLSIYGDDLRYCKEFGGWQIWDGKRWVSDEQQRVEYLVKEAMVAWHKRVEQSFHPFSYELATWVAKGLNYNRIQSTLKAAVSENDVVVPSHKFDQDGWLLNCENGTLDLQSGELGKHSRGDYLRKLAPVTYDPDAKCPKWLAFLDRIFNRDRELISYVQRVIGYSLTGNTGEQCLFLLHGTGQNGKSKFIQVLQAMMGDYAQSANFFAFTAGSSASEKRAAMCQLPGARMVSATESAQGSYLDEPLIKQLTGEDRVSGRRLYSEEFSFDPQLKLYLVTNHLPSVRTGDYAMWRRIKLIPFNVTILDEERDNDLLSKLLPELSGILTWAVQGCVDWQAKGLVEPDTVKQAVAGYMQEQDVIGRFIDDTCELDSRAQVGTTELHEAYQKWCEANGENPTSQKTFNKRLSSEAGLSKERCSSGPNKGRFSWMGLRLV